MKTPPPGRPKGRPPKRQRTQDELADLARRLGADWQPGDNVMTWIRRHEAADTELSRLVRDGWSWTDVGLALALAGNQISNRPGDTRLPTPEESAEGARRRAQAAGRRSTVAALGRDRGRSAGIDQSANESRLYPPPHRVIDSNRVCDEGRGAGISACISERMERNQNRQRRKETSRKRLQTEKSRKVTRKK